MLVLYKTADISEGHHWFNFAARWSLRKVETLKLIGRAEEEFASTNQKH